jgi:hypothetical protein
MLNEACCKDHTVPLLWGALFTDRLYYVKHVLRVVTHIFANFGSDPTA